MKEFKSKVAVVTGAANGIGFGIAERCAQLWMKVVLAGINADNLQTAEEKLKSTGAIYSASEPMSLNVRMSKRKHVESYHEM